MENFLEIIVTYNDDREQDIMRFDTKTIQKCEYNLPLHCVYCESSEVTYHQYIGDAYCSDCGEWQTNN